MELDDLRRQWQAQPTGLPADSPPTEQALRTILTSYASSNPLIQLKKNASRELKLILVGIVLIVFDGLIFFRHSAKMPLFATGILIVLCLVGTIVYQRRKLIHQMEQQHDDLHHFLSSRIGRFRYLMRLHDYVGVVTLVLIVGMGVVVRWADIRAYLTPVHPDWNWHIIAVGAGAIVLLILIYTVYVMGQREHQRRHGRYLDQLEAALRELRD
ncbi:hypothetical protein CDA63_13740 [Hymenobacter amundsenii]|uniref:Uncharacterized protein n=1 Tax=Hymenobacter amundsenii TaxID=2006685 RepID=A0A2D0AFJ3_9BACT|nr:hypothetical protein [Hymenobacter amundsenii]OWP62566.1 hypothetical protein CDA63_13740 [Hymenobacter amundsenii]